MPEVVAVRGQRIATVVEEFDHDGDELTVALVAVRLNAGLRRQERTVMFYVDARLEAIALLDE